MPIIFGVDPGASGAISVMVDGQLREVIDMPAATGAGSSSRRVQPAMLAECVRQWLVQWPPQSQAPIAVLEQVAAMPGQGVTSVFNFGHALGAAEAVFSALQVRVEWVTPAKWKGDLGLTVKKSYAADDTKAKAARRKQAKEAARALASRLYPSHAGRWAAACHDGRAEAALLAHWYANVRRGDGSQ